MKKENVGDIFNDYLRESLKNKMIEAVCKVNTMLENLDKGYDREEIIRTLFEANKAISNVCMGDDELYSEHEYHLFDGVSGLWIAQGRELKTTNRYD